MKSLYYQFVNFIQTLNPVTFLIIWLLLTASVLIFIMKFFKVYNGTQKKFEKLSYLFIALLLFAVLAFLTYLR